MWWDTSKNCKAILGGQNAGVVLYKMEKKGIICARTKEYWRCC